MKTHSKPAQVRFFLYLTRSQSDQVLRLREAGLSISTIGRQAIRKCHEASLVAEEEIPRPERCNLYLTPDDAALLDSVAARENCPKAVALRRLVATYLAVNASAIDSLF